MAYSHEAEASWYRQHWPTTAKPYSHLTAHLSCWLEPDRVFRDKRVLDIGAGEATYTRLIAERWRPERVVACDLFTRRMMPAARANTNGRLSFVAGDCFSLPFPEGAFDVVFGSLVLHQLPELDRVAREVRRVLRPTGCYVGIEPNPLNPLHLYRYLTGRHSSNQYLLRAGHLEAFTQMGFDVRVTYFYARFPRVHTPLLAASMGIMARLPGVGVAS